MLPSFRLLSPIAKHEHREDTNETQKADMVTSLSGFAFIRLPDSADHLREADQTRKSRCEFLLVRACAGKCPLENFPPDFEQLTPLQGSCCAHTEAREATRGWLTRAPPRGVVIAVIAVSQRCR